MGPEAWKIFAGAVETIIREKGNLRKEIRTFDEIKSYYKFVKGQQKYIIWKGHRYQSNGKVVEVEGGEVTHVE